MIVSSVEQDTTIAAVKNYIRPHLDDNLTRESLAAMVYLTPDYLSHLFKCETGFSLTNYIIYERIDEAKRLLAGSGQSISDITTRCGFQNISYFSKQFKRFTGGDAAGVPGIKSPSIHEKDPNVKTGSFHTLNLIFRIQFSWYS